MILKTLLPNHPYLNDDFQKYPLCLLKALLIQTVWYTHTSLQIFRMGSEWIETLKDKKLTLKC